MTVDSGMASVRGTPRMLLRLEGLLLAGLCIWLFARLDEPWWLFGVLLLAPDLSMLGYLGGAALGAASYNLFHTLSMPILAILAALAGGSNLALAIGLIWCAHIGVDRALGYGLKYPSRFADTHLGPIGRARKAE
ncbi:DUF4260 domain-containing protein [Bosea sp. CS1GBMeth4]|uniref:DUF4260 domain-containing protein n=1 Tax=Bosea sp. CS1GBMeth4 TaxID=1892849 RepID=UPI001FCE9D4B|nr:DUF4260 domain-containing protein [Bosea sp. CS1GBMeth4]